MVVVVVGSPSSSDENSLSYPDRVEGAIVWDFCACSDDATLPPLRLIGNILKGFTSFPKGLWVLVVGDLFVPDDAAVGEPLCGIFVHVVMMPP